MAVFGRFCYCLLAVKGFQKRVTGAWLRDCFSSGTSVEMSLDAAGRGPAPRKPLNLVHMFFICAFFNKMFYRWKELVYSQASLLGIYPVIQTYKNGVRLGPVIP
jgi:hypothetical protein